MADSRTGTRSSSSEAVVQDYLDFMLQEAVSTLPESPPPEPVAEAGGEPVAQEPVAKQPLAEEQAPAVDGNVAGSSGRPEPSGSGEGLPDWAQSRFGCLVFEVRGMSMAAAMTTLGGILPIEDRLSPVAAQAEWFMGLLRYNGRNIRVVDTAQLLMPRQAASPVSDGQSSACRGYGCVLILDGTDWGLAIDEAGESVTLEVDQVRWRRRAGSRPWLAGTISRRLCALLDTPWITGMLQHSGQQSVGAPESSSSN